MKILMSGVLKFDENVREVSSQVLNETSWQRIIRHMQNQDMTVAYISPYTREYSPKENQNRWYEMAQELKERDFGYIPIRGGYTYQSEENGEELSRMFPEVSFLIPKISLEEALDLAARYEQESVLFKDGQGLRMVFAKDVMTTDGPKKRGDVDFTLAGTITTAPDKTKDFYSMIMRGGKHQRQTRYVHEDAAMMREQMMLKIAEDMKEAGIKGTRVTPSVFQLYIPSGQGIGYRIQKGEKISSYWARIS